MRLKGVRMLTIIIDGVARCESAGTRTAVEAQHALREHGKSVRVIEHYTKAQYVPKEWQ